MNTQTFITTTHSEFLDTIKGSKQVYGVRDGMIDVGSIAVGG